MATVPMLKSEGILGCGRVSVGGVGVSEERTEAAGAGRGAVVGRYTDPNNSGEQ